MSDYREAILASLRRYWPANEELIKALPVPSAPVTPTLPVRLRAISLPAWAVDCGVDGALLVPVEAASALNDWHQIDWWWVAHWFLHSLAEREHERRHGPIHSYSLRLAGWDGRMWDHAWVNRIALFLRRWAAIETSGVEEQMFGARPRPEILVTHDLDAIEKTVAIRLKQSAFHAMNAVRAVAHGRWREAASRAFKACRFLVRNEDYRHFNDLMPRADEASVSRIVNVFGGCAPETLRDRLFDPSYDVASIRAELLTLHATGTRIGLHPSFASWNDRSRIHQEKARVEAALGLSISTCRQHWLRFSFADTWAAQADCGITQDTTLGFNDRPGLRNGAALAFRPQRADGSEIDIESWPLLLMDSQLYDYQSLDHEGRGRAIDRWLDELGHVGGQASVLWHPHTLGEDYGWRNGFETLLMKIHEVGR